jgi:DNA-binding protein WhiA
MSFSADVKTELCHLNKRKCCQKSEAYGLLFFSNKFSRDGINFNTESLDTAKLFKKRMADFFNINLPVTSRESFKNIPLYEFKIYGDETVPVFENLSYNGKSEDAIIRSIFDRECCLPSFLRGAFLACGYVENPKKNYRITFTLSDSKKQKILKDILSENGFIPKERQSKNQYILYFKDSAYVEDLLTFLGAQNSSLLVMSEKIEKDIANNANRAKNCDSANIDRTLSAVEKQISAIEFIKEKRTLLYLPENLREVAEVRVNNPEVPLSELCKLTSVPMSKSGINHRLQKIIDIANKLKEED